ncbi:MAG: hypothetical protein CMH49_09025 [Myxococcales bacterium]|nr:hypothetical protein [Myxococcales bacterium]
MRTKMSTDWSNVALKDALFMCFDLETTGIDIAKDRIVQLAVSYFSSGQIIQQHSRLLNPECPIPEQSSAVHGIYDQTVQGQPTFSQFLPKLIPHFQGQILRQFSPPILLGYNLISYDIPLFKHELKRIHADETLIDLPVIDLIYFARWYLRNKKNKLVDLCKYFKVPLEHAHNALFDAKACGLLLPIFYQAGYLGETVGEVLDLQNQIKPKLDAEYKQYRMWLYRDRFTGDLTLGQGKYQGIPLTQSDPSYLRHCVSNYDLPVAVKEAFESQLSRK